MEQQRRTAADNARGRVFAHGVGVVEQIFHCDEEFAGADIRQRDRPPPAKEILGRCRPIVESGGAVDCHSGAHGLHTSAPQVPTYESTFYTAAATALRSSTRARHVRS